MGILRYFKYVYDNHSKCLINLKSTDDVKIGINCLAFDLNSLIHPICQKAFNYNTGSSRLFLKKKRQVTHKELFDKVSDNIQSIVKFLKPMNQLIISMDGVAGMSKINQQRKRRFVSVLEKSEDEFKQFDSNCISAGTKFMNDLSRHLHFWITKKVKTDWSHLNVVFSNEKTVGEAEHKLIRYIENNHNPDWTYCIQSPDADLIMLLMGLKSGKPEEGFFKLKRDGRSVNKLYIYRDNIYDFCPADHFLVDIDKLYSETVATLKWEHKSTETSGRETRDNDTRDRETSDKETSDSKLQFNEYNSIIDYILMIQFLGNDFVPCIPSMELENNTLTGMFDIYKKVCSKYGHLTKYKIKDKKKYISIRRKSLSKFFYQMTQTEEQMLFSKSTKRILHPDTILLSCVNNDNTINIHKYRTQFYKVKMNITSKNHSDKTENTELNTIETLCVDYLRMLTFVLRYYLDEIPDWRYVYKHNYAPFFNELTKYTGKFDSKCEFQKNSPFTPFEQLLSILPPKSVALLPTALQPLMESDSELAAIYPLTFQVDLEGKKTDHEKTVILPFVDDTQISTVFNKFKNKLILEDKKINIFGKTSCYCKNITTGEVDVKYI